MRSFACLVMLLLINNVHAGDGGLVRRNNDGVAIDGYSSVSYYQRGQAELLRTATAEDLLQWGLNCTASRLSRGATKYRHNDREIKQR